MRVELERSFENVYVYVADALRYDSVPDDFADRWPLVKTVSSSPVSASSFPSMATGLYPPQHGVYRFSDSMDPEIPTIFDLFPGDSPFYFGVDILSLSGREGVNAYNHYHRFEERLREIEGPFFVMDRELVTHDPYGYDVSGNHLPDDRPFETSEEYWQSRRGDTAAILRDYRRGAQVAVERFEQRMEILRERGLLEDTLVIFTADHGELLADHAFLQHSGGVPIYPELVYVPTLFCSKGVEVDGDFMAHVDLFPTLAAIAGEETPDGVVDESMMEELPGYNLLDGAPDDRLVYNEIEHSFLDRETFERRSVWDADGGYVFTDQALLDRVLEWARNFHPRYPASVWYRRHPLVLLRQYFGLRERRGNPKFSRRRAKEYCRTVESESRPAESAEVGDGARERLKALGYSERDI